MEMKLMEQERWLREKRQRRWEWEAINTRRLVWTWLLPRQPHGTPRPSMPPLYARPLTPVAPRSRIYIRVQGRTSLVPRPTRAPARTEYGWRKETGSLDIVWEVSAKSKSSLDYFLAGCKCKTGCTTRKCSCRKKERQCGPSWS